MKFTKSATTYDQQADILLGRGLIADRAVLVRRLQAVGYYRLCAYWHPFKRPNSSFVPGTTLDVVWQRYTFDRQLRLAVMDAIERVEVAVRTVLLTELALRSGPFVHLDVRNFPGVQPSTHARFLDELRETAQKSREVFVHHFRTTYDEFPDLPIWAAAEIMSFGTMLTLYNMSGKYAQNAIAARYNLPGWVLSSWLLTLNYTRNLCAHHARLWNRELAIRPQIPFPKRHPEWHDPVTVPNKRIFAVLTLLQFLLRQIAPQSHWRDRLFGVFDRFPEIPLPPMDIPDGWRTHRLWQ